MKNSEFTVPSNLTVIRWLSSKLIHSIAVIALAFLAPKSEAQERPATEDLLPETTVAFVQIDNWNDFYQKVQEGSLGKMLRDEKIAPLIDNLWNEAQQTYKEEAQEQVGVELSDFTSLPHGEITVAIVAPKRQNPEFFLIMQTDPESEAADRILERGRELVEESGNEVTKSENDDGFEFETIPIDDRKFKFFRKDGLIVGSTSEDELDDLIDRWMGREVEKIRPLSQNRKFITIMNRCKGSRNLKPEARFFVDPIELAKSATRGDIGAQFVIGLLPTLGLDGLLGIGGSMLLAEDEFTTLFHAHILLSEPREGVFKMFAFRPTDYQPESWMPFDTFNYFTTSWDVPMMMQELTKIIDTFQTEGTVDRFFTDIADKEIGFNIREELIGNLTGRVTFAQWIEKPVTVNSQVPVFAFEVKDPAAMEPILEKIIERINRDQPEDSQFRWSGESHKGVVVYAMNETAILDAQKRSQERRNERRREEGQQVYDVELEVNPTQPSFALLGNYLIISQQSRKAIERMIETEQGEIESLALNKDFKRVASKMTRTLKTDMPSGMFYSDPRVVFSWMFDLARAEKNKEFLKERSTEQKTLGRFVNVLENNPLPEFSEVEHYFQPQGGYMTSDETGLHFLFFELKPEDEKK